MSTSTSTSLSALTTNNSLSTSRRTSSTRSSAIRMVSSCPRSCSQSLTPSRRLPVFFNSFRPLLFSSRTARDVIVSRSIDSKIQVELNIVLVRTFVLTTEVPTNSYENSSSSDAGSNIIWTAESRFTFFAMIKNCTLL